MAAVNPGQRVLLRDFIIFQLKLVLDAFKDIVVIKLSILAAVFDLLFGRSGRPLLFYSVIRGCERFDLWLNLYGAARGAETQADGLFGASEAGDDTLVGKLEELVDQRARRRGGMRAPAPDPAPDRQI